MPMVGVQGIITKVQKRADINSILPKPYGEDANLSGPEIIELIDFWESYPHFELNRRTAIVAMEVRAGAPTVELWLRPNERRSCEARRGGWQLSFRADDLAGSPKIVRLFVNGAHVELAMESRQEDSGVWWWDMGLRGIFDKAESLLLPEFTKRGLDGGALIQSGRICRQLVPAHVKVEQTQRGIRQYGVGRWPQFARSEKLLEKLSSAELYAVVTAEKDCIKLIAESSQNRFKVITGPRPQAILDGTAYDISHDVAELLQAVVSADGGYVSGTDFGVRSRQLDGLPKPLSDFIERERGKGIRISS